MNPLSTRPNRWCPITVFNLLVGLLFSLSALAQPAFLNDGLVAYYPFNGNANDASGNGKNGVVQGPVSTTDRFGSPNSAYYFNGAGAPYHPDSQLQKPQRITSQLNQNFNNGFTFSAWVLPDSVQKSGDNYIFGVGSNSNRRYGLSSGGEVGGRKVTTPGFRSFYADYTSQSGYKVAPSVWGPNPQTEYNPANSQWLHITYIVSSSLKIYINGVEKDSQAVGGPTGEAISNFVLGDFEDPISGRCWQGKIDDVRIHNRALSDTEVQALYAYESTPPDNSFITNGLVAYYPFNGNANDESGNQNNATPNNSTFSQDRYGKEKSAIQFSNSLSNYDGVKSVSYLLIPTKLVNSISEEGSISLWVKPENGIGGILCKAAPTMDSSPVFTYGGYSEQSTGWSKIGESGKLYFRSKNTGNLVSSKNSLKTGVWNHITLSYSKTKCTIFIDGTPDTSVSGDYSISQTEAPVLYNSVGGYLWDNDGSRGNPNLYSNGIYDDVRIYNRALSDSEVNALYKTEVPSKYGWEYIAGNFTWAEARLDSIAKGYNMALWSNTDELNSLLQFVLRTQKSGWLNLVWEGGWKYSVGNTKLAFTGPLPQIINRSPSTVFPYGNMTGVDGVLAVAKIGISPTSAAGRGGYLVRMAKPVIQTQPLSRTVQVRSNFVISVGMKLPGEYSYQWQLNQANIIGATSSILSIKDLAPGKYNYRVVVSNIEGSVFSRIAAITVTQPPAPVISNQPLSTTKSEGSLVTLNIVASGFGRLKYQWQFNGANINGATSSTLSITAVRPSNAGRYRVIVSDLYSSTTSAEATVGVSTTDGDLDGLSDYEELLLKTNSKLADSDGDGLSDFQEVITYKTNPLNTDTDGDGYSDAIEIVRGGDAKDANITPTRALTVYPAVDVEFYTVKGIKYKLQVSTDGKLWTSVGSVLLGNGRNQNHLVRANESTSFWRLIVVQ